MIVDRNRLVDLLKRLPEELQGEVVEFAESLLQKTRIDPSGSREEGTPSEREPRRFALSLGYGIVTIPDRQIMIVSTLTLLMSSHEADT